MLYLLQAITIAFIAQGRLQLFRCLIKATSLLISRSQSLGILEMMPS